MTYIIKEYKKYNETEILELYESVGWINYTKNPTMLKEAYSNSLKIYGAYITKDKHRNYDESTTKIVALDTQEKLVGVIRVVGDGHSVVFVQDILVLPEYQRLKIGTALFQQILSDYSHVYQMHLLTENTEKTIEFYKSMGFVADIDTGCIAFSRYQI